MTKRVFAQMFIGLMIWVILTASLSSCNKGIVDLKLKFDRCMIKMPDGTVKTVKVKKWYDYENSDQMQVLSEDGTLYLTHACNIVLIKDGDDK